MSDALFRAHQRIAAMQNELDALNHDVLAAITELAQRRAVTLDAVRASDEAQMNMGGDAGEPCSDPHPDFHATTHQFCQQQCSGGMCCDDDPPSREP